MIKDVRSLCAGTLLTCAAVLPLSAPQAASPVFNNWSVTDGDISYTCGAQFSCSILSTGDGFIQVQWVDTDGGVTYIQTVVTDPGASGDPDDPDSLAYMDESFVQLGGSNGIYAQQRHSTTEADGTFTNSSQLAIGWANTTPNGANPTMTISQQFVSAGELAVAGDEFSNAFVMELINDGGARDRSISIDQRVGLGDGTVATDDVQRFVLEGRQGAFTQTGDIDLGSSFGGATQGADPAPVTWANGDDIMMRWIGQRLELVQEGEPSQGESVFGFQGIVNNTGGVEATTFSTASTGIVPDGASPTGYQAPFDWHATFGNTPPTPALPVVNP
jgi:hypothetical protein